MDALFPPEDVGPQDFPQPEWEDVVAHVTDDDDGEEASGGDRFAPPQEELPPPGTKPDGDEIDHHAGDEPDVPGRLQCIPDLPQVEVPEGEPQKEEAQDEADEENGPAPFDHVGYRKVQVSEAYFSCCNRCATSTSQGVSSPISS